MKLEYFSPIVHKLGVSDLIYMIGLMGWGLLGSGLCLRRLTESPLVKIRLTVRILL